MLCGRRDASRDRVLPRPAGRLRRGVPRRQLLPHAAPVHPVGHRRHPGAGRAPPGGPQPPATRHGGNTPPLGPVCKSQQISLLRPSYPTYYLSRISLIFLLLFMRHLMLA